jgi:tetratricopeptide (TPR) repeat protein
MEVGEISTALDRAGTLIFDNDDAESQETAIGILENLRSSRPTEEDLCISHYYSANAWGRLRKARGKKPAFSISDDPTVLNEFEKEIFHYRSALRRNGGNLLEMRWLLSTMTDLANAYDSCGRFIEAIELYDRALDVDESWGMARGSRGISRLFYARSHSLINGSHAWALHRAAISDLSKVADSPENVNDEALSIFKKHLEDAKKVSEMSEKESDIEAKIIFAASIRSSPWLAEYSTDRLFLHPGADVFDYPTSAHDCLSVPSTNADFLAMFDGLTREFITARSVFLEGITSFNERAEVMMQMFGHSEKTMNVLAVEKVKLAFRSAYSILDKVAVIINSYFMIGVKTRNINFGLLHGACFDARIQNGKNRGLMALVGLSKDFWAPGKKGSLASVADLDAKRNDRLRAASEHRFVRLVRDDEGQSVNDVDGFEADVVVISAKSFFNRTRHMLRTARAAIFYLAHAIAFEEHARSSGSKDAGSA